MGGQREIPFAAAPRPDTGFSNTQLGMGLFLTADLMLFGGLFSAYVLLRVNAELWPPGPFQPVMGIGVLKTGLLLLVSAGMNRAQWRVRNEKGVRDLWLVSGAAALFLATTSYEYFGGIQAGIVPAVNTYIGMYYALSGVHLAHVFGGLIATILVAATGGTLGKPDPVRLLSRTRATALYWHFLTLVWIVFFGVLYLA